MRSLAGAIAGALLLTAPQRALAQDSAVADALFDRGLAEMTAGQFDTGCPKLAESQRLDPRPGTLFTLAECEAQGGKIASAIAHYEEYLRLFNRSSEKDRVGQRGRDGVAKAAVARLGPEVPTLTLRLPAGARRDAQVIRNGTRLGRAALGVPLPVDPGEQVLAVELPDGSRREQRINIARSEKKDLELALPSDAAPETTTVTAPAATDSTEPAGGPSNTLAYVAGGIGLAGIAVGAVTGAMVFGKKGTVGDHCSGSTCDQQGLDAADSAKTLGLVSNIGFGVGVVGLATATVLLLTGKRSGPPADGARRPTPVVATLAGGGFVGVGGRW